MRKIIGVVLALAIIVSFSLRSKTICAYEQIDMTENFVVDSVNQTQAFVSLSVSNSGLASVSSIVRGEVSAKRISQSISLQRYDKTKNSWFTVKSWSKVDNSDLSKFSTTHSLSKHGKYRIQVIGSVLVGTSSEKFSKCSSEVKY